jgi:hypothetical protein
MPAKTLAAAVAVATSLLGPAARANDSPSTDEIISAIAGAIDPAEATPPSLTLSPTTAGPWYSPWTDLRCASLDEIGQALGLDVSTPASFQTYFATIEAGYIVKPPVQMGNIGFVLRSYWSSTDQNPHGMWYMFTDKRVCTFALLRLGIIGE